MAWSVALRDTSHETPIPRPRANLEQRKEIHLDSLRSGRGWGNETCDMEGW